MSGLFKRTNREMILKYQIHRNYRLHIINEEASRILINSTLFDSVNDKIALCLENVILEDNEQVGDKISYRTAAGNSFTKEQAKDKH